MAKTGESPFVTSPVKAAGQDATIRTLPLDERRGIYAMWCVIATEASLFFCLYGAYFYLGNTKQRWAVDQPPKLHYAWIMLVVLLASGVLLRWGETKIKQFEYRAGRLALLVTIILGLGFLILQSLSYVEHLKTLAPYSDSYGSIFYAISAFHVAHVVVGVLILAYTLVLPRYGSTSETPYRPYQTAALYWYFVIALFISVFVILYIIPNLLVYG